MPVTRDIESPVSLSVLALKAFRTLFSTPPRQLRGCLHTFEITTFLNCYHGAIKNGIRSQEVVIAQVSGPTGLLQVGEAEENTIQGKRDVKVKRAVELLQHPILRKGGENSQKSSILSLSFIISERDPGPNAV